MSTIMTAGVTASTNVIYRVGIDCGSKTIKSAVIDPDDRPD